MPIGWRAIQQQPIGNDKKGNERKRILLRWSCVHAVKKGEKGCRARGAKERDSYRSSSLSLSQRGGSSVKTKVICWLDYIKALNYAAAAAGASDVLDIRSNKSPLRSCVVVCVYVCVFPSLSFNCSSFRVIPRPSRTWNT